ncbi:unnamed protein product [Cochlearia groenlandica]
MLQISDSGASLCENRDQIELQGEICFESHGVVEAAASASNIHRDDLTIVLISCWCLQYIAQGFASSSRSIKEKSHTKCSPRRIVSSNSSMGNRFVTFTLAPVDVRHCRLRLPIQFTRENGINKPGKIHLLGNDGSKWLANLLIENRGRMTLGDGWKSFVKANGLKTGENYTLELIWEDTAPVLCLCPAEYSNGEREGEEESVPVEPSSGNNIIKDENRKDVVVDENSKEESSSWERDKNHLIWRDSTTLSQNRFLTVTITPDSLRHGRLRLPLQFMWENHMNTPGDITLLGKDGAKWLVSLLLEKRERMCLGKGWKDFAKANGLKTGDSIMFESIWVDTAPVLNLLRVEPSSDRRQQSEYSKKREKESTFTKPTIRNKTRNIEETKNYPLKRRDSYLAIHNQFAKSTLSHEIVRCVAPDFRIGEIVFRDDGDMMFHDPDLGLSSCETRDVLAPNSNHDQDNIGSIFISMHPHLRKEAGCSTYDGDDQYNIEPPRKKKAKKNNPRTEADSSLDRSCFVAHVTASSLHTDTLYLPKDFRVSDGLTRKSSNKYSPTQINSSYSASEKQLATFTLAPIDVRNCRLRLPMQFTKDNGINKPGKIYLLGKDGTTKWHANLLLESRGRMTLGDGWKSFVKANGLKTGESFALKLNWEDTTPVLSLCPADYSINIIDEESCSEAREKEPLLIEPNNKEASSSWESEKNHMIWWRDSALPSQNRFLTLTITPDSLRHGRLRLPLQFMRENNMNTPGEITLLGKDGAKWLVSLLLERRGRMNLGKGWRDFAKSNGLKTGDSVTFESFWEAAIATPVLSLVRVESTDGGRRNEYLKQPLSTRHSSGNKTKKAENNEEREYLDSSSSIQNRAVLKLILTHEHVRDCKLYLPSWFMRTNGIVKPGEITLLGRSGMKWSAYLLSEDGTVDLGNGWRGFCEANGVMVGESFVLELIHGDDTSHVFKSLRALVLLIMEKNQHFFKPLLPGFNNHLMIPITFFSKNIEGRSKHKTGELRSDASVIAWKVKLEGGKRLTDGWNEFALAHDLRVGDIVVFRQEIHHDIMSFHVTMLGPSCCEIQYDDSDHNNLGKIHRKKNPRKETESSIEPSCFVAKVMPSTLRYDRLTIPRSFVKENGLEKRYGEIVLMNEKGRSWTVVLKGRRTRRSTYISRGFRSFCNANGLKVGDIFTFKLIQRGNTMVLRMSLEDQEVEECIEANEIESLSTEHDIDEESDKEEISSQECFKRKARRMWKASSSVSQNPFVIVTLTPYDIRLSRLVLPRAFTKVNGISNINNMSLLDKQGVKWSTSLWFDQNRKRMRIVGGWKEFCDANNAKIGESIMLELIWEEEDKSCVLKFCSKVKPET